MDYQFPRVQALPDYPDRVSLRIDGREYAGYVFNPQGSRPFLYPVLSKAGNLLTRIGHPNPVGHEHHKSVWFGHQFVGRLNFWEEKEGSLLSQVHRRVNVYQDGETWAGFAADIEWREGDQTLLNHRLIVAIEAQPDGNYTLDLQNQFEAAGAGVELGRTNFGLVGVRVARGLSARYGGGTLTGDTGATGEPALFGKKSRWVDASGPSAPGVIEGITYLDHPDNPRHPSAWHVRDDGWMEAAFTLADSYLIPPEHPLELRYRLWIHDGSADLERIKQAWQSFAERPAYRIKPAERGEIPSLVLAEG